jgi:hypothetical protein
MTLKRRRRTTTIAGSRPRAIELNHIEQGVGDGPCIQALLTMTPMVLNDVGAHVRWPAYQEALSREGVLATLGVPLAIDDDASAAINFFAPKTGLFAEDAYERALAFGDIAGRSLRLAVRIGAAENRAEDLKAAMQSRTSIDLAAGVIMGQNRCSQGEAMTILAKVSSNRNQKLRDVAAELLERISDGAEVKTHFDE